MKTSGTDSTDPSGRHLIFLHGIFGQASSFRFLAKKREIQQNFTVHLLDMRNHGGSGRHADMDYLSLAHDLYQYMEQHRLTDVEKSVSLVGHSMGGKAAMTFAALFPELVHQLVSLDSPPVDRSNFPELNVVLDNFLDGALALGDLNHLGDAGAR